MKRNRSFVSIILIFHNANIRALEAGIKSVLGQTHTNWELLLIDDGSSNKSSNLARNYALLYPKYLSYIEHERHQILGISASYNLGINQAKGTYISFLDANNLWLPDKLQYQLNTLENHPEAGAVFNSPMFSSHQITKTFLNQKYELTQPNLCLNSIIKPPQLLPWLLLNPEIKSFALDNILLRREIFNFIGLFEPRLLRGFTLEAFLVKICLNIPIIIQDQSLIRELKDFNYSQVFYPETKEYYSLQVNSAHKTYLSWLQDYLLRHQVNNYQIWQAINHQLLPYRYSWFYKSYYFLLNTYVYLLRRGSCTSVSE